MRVLAGLTMIVLCWTPHVLDDAHVDLESTDQVLLPVWTRGRCAMFGDAACCASPLSRMGTSLALTGVCVLADALARHDDHAATFAAHEKLMRPSDRRPRPPGERRRRERRGRLAKLLPGT